MAAPLPPLEVSPNRARHRPDQDEAKKLTPSSLCLTACPKWDLGLRERQGSNELSAPEKEMSITFSQATSVSPGTTENCVRRSSVGRGRCRPPRNRVAGSTRVGCEQVPHALPERAADGLPDWQAGRPRPADWPPHIHPRREAPRQRTGGDP
jgi:hypothetical protein